MTTEGKSFKKKHFGASGGKTGESDPNTVFDKKKHRWVLAVGEEDIQHLPSHLKDRVKKLQPESKERKYAQRDLKPETGKLAYKKKPENFGEKALRLTNQEASVSGISKKWNVFRDKNSNTVYKMSGENKINGHNVELIIKEPKRGTKDPENVYLNAFVLDKETGEVISNINIEIDGKGKGLFENGFEGCVKEMQFNPKYSKYLSKYMMGDLAGNTPEEAAKAVCGAILDEHGGAGKVEKQALVMTKFLLENKFFKGK
jgi:hypothetical protein